MAERMKEVVDFIRDYYDSKEFIALHEPVFLGNEKKYLNECIDSTFVSSVGKFVDLFEEKISAYTGAKYAIATVNGTAALHVALMAAGVNRGDEVITQPLTFVATCNAISYCGAEPLFVDVDRDTMGISPERLRLFLENETVQRSDGRYNKTSGRRIAAVVPMHTFGHPCRIDAVAELCEEHNLALVEDAAESLGSFYKGRHTGTFGRVGVFSFNGNKTITTGGGGMIVTDDETLAKRAKHLSTTAKVGHPYEYIHDTIGYNYRLPNINAALGCAQMEKLDFLIEKKRALAADYQALFKRFNIEYFTEPNESRSNYWLNAIILSNIKERNAFLEYLTGEQIMVRPVWRLMNKLEMFKACNHGDLSNSLWLEERVVNLPSGLNGKQ